MKKTAMFVMSLVPMSLLTAGLGISASTKPSSVEKGKQAPDWRIEITRAGQEAPERTLTADCSNPVDEPAADPDGYPTRACSKTLDYIADGSYNLRIIGGPYSDQTDGAFHIGTDLYWPHIQIFNPTPRAGDSLSMGDPMTVSFSVNPAAANVAVMIQRHGEIAYLFPALGSANSADCTVDGNIRR